MGDGGGGGGANKVFFGGYANGKNAASVQTPSIPPLLKIISKVSESCLMDVCSFE